MDLRHRGNHKRRSLDLLTNAVRTTYTTLDYTGDNMITNGDFETGDMSGWTHNNGAASVSPVHSGSYAGTVTSAGANSEGHDANYIRQNVNGTPGISYRLTCYIRGDGTNRARVGVRDPNESDWLIQPQARGSASAWTKVVLETVCPPEGELLYYFYGGRTAGSTGNFDDVEVLERGEAVYETDWATDYPSISNYGRREWMEPSDNLPLASSEAFRDSILAFQKDPWPRPVGLGASDEIVLTVRVCGYVWTMNWLYVMEGDGSAGNLSDWLSTLVGTSYGLTVAHATTSDTVTSTAGDCQFVRVGRVDSNTLQVNQKATMDERAWDLIMEMVKLGIEDPDSAGAYIPARCYIGNNRLFTYEAINTTPQLYLRGGQLYNAVGARQAVSPYSVWPCVVRDMDYPVSQALYNSIFDDVRDSYVDEVEVDEAGNVSLRSTVFSDLDIWRTRADLLEFSYEPIAPPPGVFPNWR